VLRVAVGFCFAGIHMTIESWLNDRATDETRGRVLAIYLIVSWTGLIAAKLAFGLADPALLQPFALATLGICLDVGPVAFTTTPQPPQPEAGRIDLGGLFHRVPLALVGCAPIGLANGAFWTLAPIFVAAGHEGHQAAGYVIALAILGGAAAQWPLGLLSDRADRRLVVMAVAVAGALAGLALAIVGPGGSLIFLLAFGFGAAALPLYSICVAHANDRVERAQFVEISGGLLMTFGAGAAVGPMLASLLVCLDGPGAVFLFTAGAHLALAVYALVRVLRQPPVPAEERGVLVAVPKSTPAAIPLDPRVAAAPPAR
jgi:MFS family permease